MTKYIRRNVLLITFLLVVFIKLGFGQHDTLYLSFSDALDLALKKSPCRTEATIDNRSGLLNLANSISAMLPTPSLSASYTISERAGLLPITVESKTYSGSVGLNQVLFNPDVYGNVYKGKLYYDYYRLQAKEKTADLVYSVKLSYYTLSKTYNLYSAAHASLLRAEANYNLAQEKERLGQITQFELLRSETFKTQAQIDLLTTEKNLNITMEDLKGHLGFIDNTIIRPISTPTVPDLDIDLETIFQDIYEQNPGFQSTRKTKSIAKTSFVQSLANLLPSANLFWQSSYSDSVMPKSVANWKDIDAINYGVRLNFPIFEIKSYLLDLGSSRNELRRANVQYKKAEILLRKNAINAIFSFKESKQRYDYASKNLDLNRTLLRLAQQQYRLGAISQLDLFDTEINFTTAQNSYISALYDTYTSYAQIEYLLGVTSKSSE